ncbi:MAG: hypothetical protein KAV87_56205 [Desulfobacteraceae bacterium]|nr:hypothetical protein [Desulfobacteraceae bacterium]
MDIIKPLIANGYLALVIFIAVYIIILWQKEWFDRHLFGKTSRVIWMSAGITLYLAFIAGMGGHMYMSVLCILIGVGLLLLLHPICRSRLPKWFRIEGSGSIQLPPWRKWTWDKPPENCRPIFYTNIVFGTLFLLGTIFLIGAPGYAIMCGILSAICWIIAIRVFFRVRRLGRQVGKQKAEQVDQKG